MPKQGAGSFAAYLLGAFILALRDFAPAGRPPSLFSRPCSILLTSMHSLRRESASLGDIAPMSRARIRWYSSSQPELSAIRRNRANSLSLSWRLPSTMFAGMDIAARIIWPRSDWSCDRRIPVATRWVCTASACAFRQTCNFLKSLTPKRAVESLDHCHRFIPTVVCSISPQRDSVISSLGTPPEKLRAKQLQSFRLPASVLWMPSRS